jgi:myo-inositol-1(or 4)-monophosphatase
MDSELKFISDVLRSSAAKIDKKKTLHESYSYKKGYLSEADLIVNDHIQSEIIKHSPDSSILSEEDKFANRSDLNEDVWVIDPICGTTNFVKGIPLFVHSISLLKKGNVTFSGIFDPSRDELFLANRKETTLNGKVVYVSKVQNLNEALIAVNCNQSDWSRKQVDIGKVVYYLMPPISRRLRIVESANLELAYVACGRLDAYFNPDDKIWDVAGGSLMVKSSGGDIKIIRESISLLTKNYLGVIGTNGYLLSSIDDLVKPLY